MSIPTIGLTIIVGLGVLFGALFWLCLSIRNFGFVDVAWSYGFTPVAASCLFLQNGWLERKVMIALMASIWSIRLGTHLFRRVLRHHPEEDGRYQTLRKEWGSHLRRSFFLFFEFQALLIVALSAPFLIACNNPTPALSGLEIAACILWILAVAGEAMADWQMDRFKASRPKGGEVCQVGLWRYSRHPNYFFEFLIWCSFSLFALASSWGWVSLYCPALMLFFLFRVTGIPATEAQAIRSKGEAYREYQRTTSVFIPWFYKV